MKYKINNREYETYELSNKQIIDLLKTDNNLTEEERKELTDKVIERFEYENCPHDNGENDDNVFVRQFSTYVNGKCHSKKKTAELMAQEHRYLQNEMFKVCLEYIKKLAENRKIGMYDPRNEYACKAAEYMIDGLISADYPY